MSNILTDLTEKNIKEAIQKNFEKMCDIIPKEYFHVNEEADVKWFSSTFPFAVFNRVLSTNSNEVDLPAIIKRISGAYQSKNLPFMWMTWPSVDKPDHLEDILLVNDFEKIGSAPGMALNLIELTEEKVHIPGLELVEVRTKEDFARYSEVMRKGFGATEEMAKGFEAMNEVIFNQPEFGTHYLARLNGKEVATSSVFYLAGVAGIFNVSTLEEERGKGIGRAMTLQPLLEARLKGYHLAILHSSEAGLNVYKKIGFQEYYRIGMYMKK